MKMPVMNCISPGMKMPQIPVVKSTGRLRLGSLNSSSGP